MLMLTDTYCCLNTTRNLLLLRSSEFQDRLSPIARHRPRQAGEGFVFCAALAALYRVTEVA
jgi:hypothetical protein